jgi:hypothetical protein
VLAVSDVVVAASVAAVAGIVASLVSLAGIFVTRGSKAAVLGEVSTTNGHTAGESLSRLEDMGWRHEQRLDAVEVMTRETKVAVDEHIDQTKELIPDFSAMRARLHELIDEQDGS